MQFYILLDYPVMRDDDDDVHVSISFREFTTALSVQAIGLPLSFLRCSSYLQTVGSSRVIP